MQYFRPTMTVRERRGRLWPALGLAVLGLLQLPLHGQGSGDPTGLAAQVSGSNEPLRGLDTQQRTVIRGAADQPALDHRHLGWRRHQPRPSTVRPPDYDLHAAAQRESALGSSFGRFTSANCNHTGLADYYATSTGAPAISMESMACTDGDFGLVLETLSATMAEGPCSLGGPNCRFTMKKR